MPTTTLREARADELDEIRELLAAAYVQYRPDETDAAFLARWDPYFEEVCDVAGRQDDGSVLLVSAEGDRILGTATYYPPGSTDDWPEGWAAVRLVGVHPDARGKGIGRALTEECIRRARAEGAVAVGLYTSTIMTTAQALYERIGFVREPEHDEEIVPGLLLLRYRFDL